MLGEPSGKCDYHIFSFSFFQELNIIIWPSIQKSTCTYLPQGSAFCYMSLHPPTSVLLFNSIAFISAIVLHCKCSEPFFPMTHSPCIYFMPWLSVWWLGALPLSNISLASSQGCPIVKSDAVWPGHQSDPLPALPVWVLPSPSPRSKTYQNKIKISPSQAVFQLSWRWRRLSHLGWLSPGGKSRLGLPWSSWKRALPLRYSLGLGECTQQVSMSCSWNGCHCVKVPFSLFLLNRKCTWC